MLDAKTHLPLANVPVTVNEWRPSSVGQLVGGLLSWVTRIGANSPCNCGSQYLGTVYTDSDGKFSLEHRPYRNTLIDKESISFTFDMNNYYQFTSAKKDDGEYLLMPFSYYKMHIKNINPYDNNDLYWDGSLLNHRQLQGMYVDTIFTGKFGVANSNSASALIFGYEYSVKKQSITTSYKINVVGILDDTAAYDIFY